MMKKIARPFKLLCADGGWKDVLAGIGIALIIGEAYVILWFLQ